MALNWLCLSLAAFVTLRPCLGLRFVEKEGGLTFSTIMASPPQASKQDVAAANKVFQHTNTVLEEKLTTSSGCQTAIEDLQNRLSAIVNTAESTPSLMELANDDEHDTSGMPSFLDTASGDATTEVAEHMDRNSATASRKVARNVRDTVLTWNAGPGKACDNLFDGMIKEVEKLSPTGTSSLIEGSKFYPGVYLDVGVQGTLLFGHLGASLGIMIFGHRIGLVLRSLRAGLDSQLAGAAARIAFIAMKDVSHLDSKACVLAAKAKVAIPGLPASLGSLSVEAVFKGAGPPVGLGFATNPGVGFGNPLPIGMAAKCKTTKEMKSLSLGGIEPQQGKGRQGKGGKISTLKGKVKSVRQKRALPPPQTPQMLQTTPSMQGAVATQ